MTDTRRVRTVCAPNCGGRSLLDCQVRDGRLVHVRPAPMPDERYSGLCMRCLLLPEWVYGPERLLQPLRRRADTPRGRAEFDEVSWDEAIDAIASVFRRLIRADGGRSLGFARTTGASPLGDYRRLGALLQACDLFGGVDMAVHMGLNAVLGYKGTFGQGTNEWTDRVNARTAIIWGHNPAETAMTAFRHLLEAQEKGTRLVVIDPRYSATAVHADWWVAPRPGTDLALALGMLHIVIADGMVDEAFALRSTVAPLLVREDDGRFVRTSDLGPAVQDPSSYVVWDPIRSEPRIAGPASSPALSATVRLPDGSAARTAFDLLVEAVAELTPERVAEITGLPARDISDLTTLYATDRPASIGFGYGVDRYPSGDALTQAAATLSLLTGNFAVPGGTVGVQSHGKGYHEPLLGPDLPLPTWAKMTSVPNASVGRVPLPVRALFNCGDWINQRIADMNRITDWVEGLDLVVTVDQFWNTSCSWSDIVLPASTFLEGHEPYRDVAVAGNSVMLRSVVLEPLGGSKPDYVIERELAERLGVGTYFRASVEQRIDNQLHGSPSSLLSGLSVRELAAAGGAVRLDVPHRPNVQYEDLVFGTDTGRAEFYIERLVPVGAALPRWQEDLECLPSHTRAERFPLVMVQNHVRQRAHSTFHGARWPLEIWPEPVVDINPDDATVRRIADGDRVEITNERGHVVVVARVNADYPPGLCSVAEGWKANQYIAGNVQELTNPTRNPRQEFLWGHTNIPHYDTRVEIRPLAEAGG